MNNFIYGVMSTILIIIIVLHVAWLAKESKKKMRVTKYLKLATGIKKKTVNIDCKYKLWKYSQYPILIDGVTYKRSDHSVKYGKWHVNEDHEILRRVSDGKMFLLKLDESYLSSVVSLVDSSASIYIRCVNFSVVTEVY